jgi:hypothetical protein
MADAPSLCTEFQNPSKVYLGEFPLRIQNCLGIFGPSTKMIRGVYLSLAPIEKQTILLPSIALSMVCPAVSRDEQNKREDVGATVPDRATRSSNRMSESYRE